MNEVSPKTLNMIFFRDKKLHKSCCIYIYDLIVHDVNQVVSCHLVNHVYAFVDNAVTSNTLNHSL
jgi:hypothetical protein